MSVPFFPALRDPQTGALSAAIPLAKLVRPYRRLDVDGRTILYFLKVGAAKGSVNLRRLPPEIQRQVAMLTLNHGPQTFNLHWYPPGNEEPQVHMGLPVTVLAQAISDLADAGFAAPPEPPRNPDHSRVTEVPCISRGPLPTLLPG